MLKLMHSNLPEEDTGWDLFLGACFNIASTALFLSIMSRLSGYIPGKIVIQATNAHMYDNHFEALEEQLSYPLYKLPELCLSDNIKKVSVDEVSGAFLRICPEDISLVNYVSGPKIYAEMAE